MLSLAGKPFSVFTPYRNAWLKALTPTQVRAHPVQRHAAVLARPPRALDTGLPALGTLGLAPTNLATLGVRTGMSGGAALFADFKHRIDDYATARDFPAVKGPSYLSVHLRFGTVSVRELVAYAHARSLQPGGSGAATWLSELI